MCLTRETLWLPLWGALCLTVTHRSPEKPGATLFLPNHSGFLGLARRLYNEDMQEQQESCRSLILHRWESLRLFKYALDRGAQLNRVGSQH